MVGIAKVEAHNTVKKAVLEDGVAVIEFTSWDTDTLGIDDDDVCEIEGATCAECQAEAGKIEELLAPRGHVEAFCACGHLRREHTEQAFDATIHSRGLSPCDDDDCLCEDFTLADPPLRVHPDQGELC